MCGIAGAFWHDSRTPPEGRMEAALEAMARRGPNDRGSQFVEIPAGLLAFGHTRLSVIDLSAGGHQPMHTADGRYSVILNGEIYNYRELRLELAAMGISFRTESDTEVLLQAWATWGEAALPRLTGMFAFGMHDRVAGTLTCVRDPFGIKPLFHGREGRSFFFASELPAVKALKSERPGLNLQRAYDYLLHGDYDTTEDSFLEGIHHLMPGHLVRVSLAGGDVSVYRWWQPRVSPVSTLGFADAAQVLREKFLASIRLHLRSDVALGAALSGGLDSSSIVCAMRHVEPDMPIHTFSYVARNSAVSEERWVDLINAHTGATGHKVEVTGAELAHDLDDMIVAQGEPFGSTSIYAQYRVFQLAREHGVTVTLDGQGADELLAGYSGYPGKRARSLMDEGRYGGALAFLRGWSKWPGRSFKEGVKAAVAETIDGPVYEWLRKANGAQLSPAWLDVNLLREAGVRLRFPRQRSPWDIPGRRLASELAHSITRRGLPSLLRHGDRNSMRFSVESRVPFLTPDLADFLLTLPEEYLVSQGGETKSVLRAAMRGIVPDEVLDRRDKIGFSTPEQQWLIEMAPQVRQWLQADIKLAFLNQREILKEFDAIVAGQAPFSWQVWRWINFIRWYSRVFMA